MGRAPRSRPPSLPQLPRLEDTAVPLDQRLAFRAAENLQHARHDEAEAAQGLARRGAGGAGREGLGAWAGGAELERLEVVGRELVQQLPGG